jgi:quercetin dioxygenase-like cupin family protein
MHSSEDKMRDESSYIPTKGAVEKLNKWKDNGAKIAYLSPYKTSDKNEQTKEVLKKFGFPEGELFFRQRKDEYMDVIKKIKPDIMIDDNCASISYFDTIEPKIEETMKTKPITVKEFGGLEQLPDDPKELVNVKSVIKTIKLPQGRMFIVESNKSLSVGFLELNPHQQLEKHKRPVMEELVQVKGELTIIVFTNMGIKKILKKGKKMKIPKNQPHVHANEKDKLSLTFWRFRGDITDIIKKWEIQ